MSGLSGVSAAFIGSGKLLVACAGQWTQQGGAIHGVVSDCPIVSAWCAQKGIDRLATRQDQASWLGRAPFDYLFSIVNHAITPAAVLALPSRYAINYHDSPLPRYAGFNATSWAIMDGQTEHAVTWHIMTTDVDSGGILLQQPIDIREDDTAFSLGARCVDAGRQSFAQLLVMLASGAELPVTAQPPRENFHLRSDRPGLGLIDFRQTSTQIRNFIRALDLGTDNNWMCRPKLSLPTGLYVADQAYPADGAGPPGAILAIDSKSLTIATADGALRFDAITSLEGAPVTLAQTGAAIGQTLPAPDAAAAALDGVASKHERFWVNRLAQMRAPVLPDVTPQAAPPDTALIASQPGDAPAVLAALLAYIARTGDGEAFDLSIAKSLPAAIAPAYSSKAPLRVDIDMLATFESLRAGADTELRTQEKRGAYARDVVLRYAALLEKGEKARLPVAVRLGQVSGDPLVADSSITLILANDSYAWAYDRRAISDVAMHAMAARIAVLLASGLSAPETPIAQLDVLPPAERKLLLADWQDTTRPYADATIHHLFEQQVARTPDAVAVTLNGASLTYRQLDERANAVAEKLQSNGVGPDSLVAVCIERSLDLAVGLMAVLKAGGAYVPLDPAYPRERLAMMLEDSATKVVLSQRSLAGSLPSGAAELVAIEDFATRTSSRHPTSAVTPENLAYVIFTSGSTGRPKGVMVRHRNVSNFFTGMDERIGTQPGVWLAVTSVSFDISVLELFWTLTRGFEVVIQAESDRASLTRKSAVSASKEPMAFSLFYFAAGQGDTTPGGAYRLLLEGAKFADTHDFSAVWTPERHFHEFGGPYPNPAVTTAALATITSRVALRAGSVVLPLHNPLRVAEDWSVIDQLSGGRVGLSFASGWHADDFALMPQNYERRREIMLEGIETVQRLWRGEKIETVNGQGKTISVGVLPRPVQAMPPMWIASAGSVDTFKLAGRIGANVLTNMLGQDIDDLRNKFAAYREARREAGHEGPGTVSVMLHTFVCEDTDQARELAREPFCNYLRSSFDLVKVAPQMFPAFRQPSLDAGEAKNFDAAKFNDDDMAALMEHAFDRYFETAGLFGSPEKALAMVERLKSIGATEVACLIDFGVETDTVLESLPHLDRLRRMSNPGTYGEDESADYSIAAQIRDRRVTHLQCTPSMARMIASEPEGLAALGGLKRLMIGGEALPTDLADTLASAVSGEVHNMYGPTETTIWSTTSRVLAGQPVTIGKPIANTTVRILDVQNQPTPIGVPGELCIAGAGVVRGYLGRPDLTAERFVADPCDPSNTIYRTGDLARYAPNGDIQFLGRLDHQVKVDGYRIELGEIETVLARHASVKQAVVSTCNDDGVAKLVAYVIPGQQASGADGVERVSHWQGLWDAAYRQATWIPEPRFNTAGWNDTATGMPIPREDMREWIEKTGESILSLAPKRALEIGCGTGMVLYRIARHVEHYTGVDLSSHALETIRAELTADELKRVTLLQQPAHALEGLTDRSVDTVIINSVTQYFPDADYLEKVLRRASEIVSDGGRIFVGDVRSLEQLSAFHTNVVLQQSPGYLDNAEISRRIDKRIALDGELVMSEAFFHALVRDVPRLSRVEVRLKPGKLYNEMTQFRCDVVLHVGEPDVAARVTPIDIEFAAVDRAMQQRVPAFVVRDLLNDRVAAIHAARSAMSVANDVAASDLREMLSAQLSGAVDPASLIVLDSNYDVVLVWARSGNPARFDAVFRHKGLVPRGGVDYPPPAQEQLPNRYSNTPASSAAKGAVSVDDLREHAREFLPEYMVPSTFITLDAFPLTPNGKIDRKALPKPVQAVAVAATAYLAPPSDTEETIAGVWKVLLGLERVGLRDNIFDLGANSLLTVQANQRLSTLLGRRISLVSMFRYPTVEALAAYLGNAQGASSPFDQRAQDRQARKKDTAARRRELRAGNGG